MLPTHALFMEDDKEETVCVPAKVIRRIIDLAEQIEVLTREKD